MRGTIDRRVRRRRAWLSALLSGGWQLLLAAALLALRNRLWPEGFPGALLAALAAVNLLALLPLSYCLYQRLHEIQGGEEDEAAQY